MHSADSERQQNSMVASGGSSMIAMSTARRFPPSTKSATSRCLDGDWTENLPSRQIPAMGSGWAYAVWCACRRGERTVCPADAPVDHGEDDYSD